MIHAIIITIVAIWVLLGAFNVVWGIGQILCGLAYGVIAIILYGISFLLDIAGLITRSMLGAAKLTKPHSTAAAKSESLRPSTRSKNSAS